MSKAVLIITGPTATGKSALGVQAALALGGEIISADSMQVYRGLDIGTAKITKPEMSGVSHHMLDVAEPSEDFSAARYVSEASACARDILSRGKTPIIVGGTGLYIDSLISGRSFSASGDGALRERLCAEYDAIGGAAFRAKLFEADPERAEKLHPSDKKRLVRAAEVFELTGKTITEHDAQTRLLPPRFPSVRFALDFSDRSLLYERIDARVDKMIADGLFSEVRALLEGGLSENSTAMQAIGYKETVNFLKGDCGERDAIEKIKLSSRRYAKRQLTWLRRDTQLHWIRWQEAPCISSALSHILSNFSG